MDQAYEERGREEDRQQREDEELYEWHTQQAAREAQLDDRAAVLAHMGWNIKTTKRWQLVVEVQAGQEQHQMTVPLAENEAVRTQLTTRLNTETEYSFQGRPQEPELARKRIAEATEAHVIEERLRGEKGSKRRTLNTNDADIRPYYQMWERGEVQWPQLLVGEEVAKFIQVAAEIDPREVESQVVPATQVYESQIQTSAGSVHPDEADTVPMAPADLSNASTVLVERPSPEPSAEK